MNKRDAVFALLDESQPVAYTPAGFFLHFDEVYHQGQAGVDKHLEFFRYTGMDFVKIQFERSFPTSDAIQTPADWANMPHYGLDYFAPQLSVIEGLVKAAKAEAPIVLTLYSPFMMAGHIVGQDVFAAQIAEDPEAVKKGLEIVTDSLLQFVRECIRLGVDGFYHSTQGGEATRFADRSLFADVVKPFDLAVMNEINEKCDFNILHVCDYVGGYDDLTPYLDYPGHIINCSLAVGDGHLTGQEVAEMFGRPFMGGLERLGVLATGSVEEVTQAANDVLAAAPERFILAADCTVPSDVDWANLRAAIAAAHTWHRGQ